MRTLNLFAPFVWLITPLVGSLAAAQEAEIDFARDIRPVLATKCFNCHGPDANTREAGLRLDTEQGALAEADSGEPAIVPFDAEASELWLRVTSNESGYRMPPEDTGEPLEEADLERLKAWIDSGAKYQQHWAFAPVNPAPVPHPTAAGSASPIDAYVRQRLESLQLSSASPAPTITLARRIAVDLNGLPPNPRLVQQLDLDTRPDALARYVDRQLASPAFGERWGAVWLDLARYADSQGYAQDSPRTIWRYRDWVIRAINENQPFDQFTIDQLAGDMLQPPGDSSDEWQLIATAFHRNTMTNSEGGTDDEEFRVAAIVDRVNTTMQVWMGMTMGCAQCHSHKYDPISQTDFYRFFAVFNQTEDQDRPNEAPFLSTYSAARLQQRDQLQQQIQQQRDLVAKLPPQETAPLPADDAPLAPRYVRVELISQGGFLSLAEVQAWAGEDNLALKGKATQSSTAYDGPANLAIDGNTDGHYTEAKSTTHTEQQANPWWEVDLGAAATLNRIDVWNRSDTPEIGERLKPYRVVLLDDQRQALFVAHFDKAPSPSQPVEIPSAFGELSDSQRETLLAYRTENPSENPQRARLAELEKQLEKLTPDVTTPIMRELPQDRHRETRIHVRGNFRNQGEAVTAGVPDSLYPLAEGVEPNRLNVAKWLVDANNPLTSRVIVNRFWERMFGAGIVETSEDFGTQGELPSHPDLLDWLAQRFVDDQWDVKRLLHRYVMSATYQQSTASTPQKEQLDPRNRELSRGPRFRLPAETLRDQALASAGLLSRKMYGPSVKPPQPNLGLRAAFGGSTDWEPSPGVDRYRRGMYTFWRRTTPYPSMTTFDATSREVCTLRRIRTNTPLQALVTLNDPVYVEAAQALARRAWHETDKTPAAMLDRMFWLALLRAPSPEESDLLLQKRDEIMQHFSEDVAAATSLATDPIGPLTADQDPVELASWTVIANVLMNLDEWLARP